MRVCGNESVTAVHSTSLTQDFEVYQANTVTVDLSQMFTVDDTLCSSLTYSLTNSNQVAVT